MKTLTAQKLAQAVELLPESGADVWLTYVRETADGGDPVLPLILEGGLTWQSALLVFANGDKVAVVGNYDADPLRHSGEWDEVVPYVSSIREALVGTLTERLPTGGTIALNYSVDDVKADGLTHGMYTHLQEMLHGTVFEGRLVSAAPVSSRLRAEKLPAEIDRIRHAIRETERIFEIVEPEARELLFEKRVFDRIQEIIRSRGYGFAWDPTGDPIVNSGPESMIGHGVPSDTIAIAPGHIFHIDLGVKVDRYCSDLQRIWFVGDSVPDDVSRAFEAVRAALLAAKARLKPGAIGYEVDAVARESITAAGYPEYLHAVGHQVGRMAHDGGTLLGPLWDRYGCTPRGTVRENEVYTLELGVLVEGRGYLGLEEMVLVTADACEWLSTPEDSVWLI